MAVVRASARDARKFGLGFEARVLGTRRAQQMLRDAQDALIAPLKNKEFENAVLDDIKSRFEKKARQRDPETNQPWAELASSTVERRKQDKTAGRLKLVDTYSLRDALKIQKAGLAKAAGRTGVGESEIGFASRPSRSSPQFLVEDIARAHQFGETLGTRTLIARPFLGLNKTFGKKLEKLYKLSFETDLIEYV